jgi:WD40 repeat protein/DNA-binding SARP family transcriptional activator
MGSRLEFRILGPLVVRVDGTPVAIGGPKQRALLALLLLSANRVVSRERLVGELFAERSVNSADHALRNQVSRLRKVLSPAAGDEPRLVARAPGYLLRVEPSELDLERFERLVDDGRETLGAGDAAAAAELFRAAEALWEGRPLADLEFEPFARLEVERLEELRLAAVEERVDAELALGRQLALVGEVEALSEEHPYRERFRAQLMLALYRSGRQAEGLEVYRRTRTLLSEELGLEPGVELQELERAILTQDPSLSLGSNGATRLAPERDVCPYQGLAPFEAADAEFFFGRERLVDELVGRLADAPLLAVIGPSGSGKSSLLRAGLVPALGGFEHVLLRPGDPLPTLAPGTRTVVAVDQLEEVFAPSMPEAERRAFLDALVEVAWDPERRAIVLIAMRADFFGHVAPYVELADLIGPNHVLLGPMSVGELRRAIERPAEQVGLEVEPELVDDLVDDVAGEVGGLPLLSTALVDLWRAREGCVLPLAAYRQAGGVRGAIGRHAEAAYRSLDETGRQVARRVLLRLVAGGDGEALTRRRVTRQELEVESDERVASVLQTLVDRRLLVADETSFELVHESLIEHWPRLAGWLQEEAQSRRLHAHLTEAAVRWQSGGRDSGELYRGARLAAALEWARDDPALNRLERDFLDQSRAVSVRSTRRLRTLLAVAVVLLVAAVIAVAVALQARGSARRQATVATAQRLGAQALVEPELDRAMLLAREGLRLDDTTTTRSNLLATLLRSPVAIAISPGDGSRILDDALSPDGRTLAIRTDRAHVLFLDATTLRRIGTPLVINGALSDIGAITLPDRSLAFSPDGRRLAVGDSDGTTLLDYIFDARTHKELASVGSQSIATADMAFAPDGTRLVTGDAVNGHENPPPLVVVLRRGRDGSEIRSSRPVAGARVAGYTSDGRFLLEVAVKASYLLDARTLARLRTFGVTGVAAVSPTADIAAFGGDDGSVRLLDLRAGTVRAMDRRADAHVVSIAFSRDGTMLATGSDDGSVALWDVPTAALRESFAGLAAAAIGPLFSPDGRTLYTSAQNGTVIAWDVSGTRTLERPFRFAPVAAPGPGPRRSASNVAEAVAVSPDSSLFVTSPGPDRVTVWRAAPQGVIRELHGPCGGVISLAWSHDGRFVAATGGSTTAVVWNVATGKVVRLLRDSSGAAGVTFSPDSRILATASLGSPTATASVRLFDLQTGRQIAEAPVQGSLQDLDFSPNGKLLAATGLGDDIVIMDVERRSVVRTFAHPVLKGAIRFSPDGKTIATGDLHGDIDFWDPLAGRQVGRTLGARNGWTGSVSFDRTGTELASTSPDGKIRLWDLASGKLIGSPLPGGDGSGWGTFFPDGKHVISTFADGTGVIWNVDPAAWAAQACTVAHRNLTRAEWRDFLPQRSFRAVC